MMLTQATLGAVGPGARGAKRARGTQISVGMPAGGTWIVHQRRAHRSNEKCVQQKQVQLGATVPCQRNRPSLPHVDTAVMGGCTSPMVRGLPRRAGRGNKGPHKKDVPVMS